MKQRSNCAVLLVGILFCTVAAFGQNPPFQCIANANVPPIVRVEGIIELVGDLLLQCSGGTPTLPGAPIPQANITLFLNTQVTSFTLANGFNEAALLIDNPSTQILCQTPNTGCTATGGSTSSPNVYSGVVSGNQVTWTGVSIDPPGATGTRSIKVTNVRANASTVGFTGSGTIIPLININLSGTAPISLSPPPIPVQPGLLFSIQLNGGTSGTVPFFPPGVQLGGTITMQEGFTGSWTPQNGHPLSVLPGSGAADGTRLALNFSSIPNGMQVFVPVQAQSPTVFLGLNSATSGLPSLITSNTTLNGVPAFVQTCPGSPQGVCSLNFYGSGPSNFDPVTAPALRSFTTPFAISSVPPGFQGYMIASAGFQPSQGFAFISDVGAQKLAQGYLSVILDRPIAASNTVPHGISPASRAPAAATALPILTTVGSASYSGRTPISANALVSGFASAVGTSTATAASVPLPTSLGGISLRITDSAGTQTSPGLLFVASQQVNYLLPAGIASGLAMVEVLSGGVVVAAGAIDVVKVAPGIFSANSDGAGVAAAQAVVVAANGGQTLVNLYQLSGSKYVAAPTDLSPAGQTVYLTLYGTGFRAVSGLAGASCTVGGQKVPVTFAGVAAGYVGLDQLNIGPIPLTLAGKGEVPIQCLFDGAPTNQVTVAFK